MNVINLADAKAYLSEFVGWVEAGASIDITRRGKLVTAVARPRKRVDLLQALTATVPPQMRGADLARSMRDDDRY